MKGSALFVTAKRKFNGSRTPFKRSHVSYSVSRQRNGFHFKMKIMRIAIIDVPKGCDKIFVDLGNGMLTVSYGSRTNKREVFNQYTKQLEELPGIGDF